MTRRSLWIALAATYLAVAAAQAEQRRLVLDAQLDNAGDTRSVSLRVLCEPDPHGGAVSIELWVPQAYTRKDFDYDDFEGPDAAAGERALSQVSVVGAGGTTEITYPAAGWYSGEGDSDTFVFGLSQRSHQKGKIATLLESVDARDTRLVWVQKSFRGPKRELRATFPLGAETAMKIRDTVDVCLASTAKSKRAARK